MNRIVLSASEGRGIGLFWWDREPRVIYCVNQCKKRATSMQVRGIRFGSRLTF